MKPAVGKMVHYYDAGGVGPIAAIVTHVGGWTETHVSLVLFWPPESSGSAPREQDNVPYYTPGFGSGCWVWPPRNNV